MRALLCATALGLLAFSSASSAREQSSVYVGAGILSMNLYKFAGSSTGTITPLGRTFVPISIAYRTKFSMPTLRFSPIGSSDLDRSSTNRVVELAFPIFIGKTLKIGPGLFGYWMSGGSGSVELGNGSSTSTFYRPNRNSFSTTWSAVVGVGTNIGATRWDLDVVMTSLLTARRAFHLASTLSFEIF
jgi:hypothetical protein